MSTPTPVSTATPQTTPTAWGLAQSLVTAFLTFKATTKLGLPPDMAAIVGGGVASGVTSGLHYWAQKLHLTGT